MRAVFGIRQSAAGVLALGALVAGMAGTAGAAGSEAGGATSAWVTIRHCSKNPLLLAGGDVSCATASKVVAALKGVKPTGSKHRVHVDGFGCFVAKYGATCWRNRYKINTYSVNSLVWQHH